ncbi:MAG TPA: DUF433 domain-containing protein [Chloroflexota bacterium]|jgi:uncharacterized protein (DUF433 family)|nr:DUF433 domain-containing protein [Chloroflexota bacterium]
MDAPIQSEEPLDWVVVDPRILSGKPIVRGTRVPVALILNLLAHGYDFDRIIEAYPVLSKESVRAAIAYSERRVDREEVRLFNQPA